MESTKRRKTHHRIISPHQQGPTLALCEQENGKSAASYIKYLQTILQGGIKTRNRLGFTLIELLLTFLIVGALTAIATSSYSKYMDRSKVTQAKSDIVFIESKIEIYYSINSRYPESLDELKGQIPSSDPWGNPYQYFNITTAKGNGALRKDHNLVPINTDYDLYSMGKDGKSVSPLTAKASRDDIVRANNGAFVGLASEY